jgi:hypothetical protein
MSISFYLLLSKTSLILIAHFRKLSSYSSADADSQFFVASAAYAMIVEKFKQFPPKRYWLQRISVALFAGHAASMISLLKKITKTYPVCVI